jgi:hypothetical protein
VEIVQLIGDLGSAGAVVIVVLVFLRHIKDSDKSRRETEAANRTAIEHINHSTNEVVYENTKVIGEHLESTRRLTETNDKVLKVLDRMNGNA